MCTVRGTRSFDRLRLRQKSMDLNCKTKSPRKHWDPYRTYAQMSIVRRQSYLSAVKVAVAVVAIVVIDVLGSFSTISIESFIVI